MSNQCFKCLDILEAHPEYLICLTISPDGNFLVSSCYDITKLWDLKDGTLICSHKHYKRTLDFSLIVNSDWSQFITDYDGRIEIRDILTGEIIFHFRVDSCHSMTSSLDGKLLITAEKVKYQTGGPIKPVPIKVWNLQTGELIRTLPGHDDMASSLIVSSDGNTLLSHSYYYSTKLWSLKTGQELHTFSLLPSGYRYWIDDFTVTSTGEMIASGCKLNSDDRGNYVNLEMWNLITGQTIHSFPKTYRYRGLPLPYELKSVMTSDSKILVSGNDTNLEVWNGQTGKMLCSLQGHESRVRNLALSQDGDNIKSG